MTRVRLPHDFASDGFEQCVTTGQPGAEPRQMSFLYVPRWARVMVLICGLPGLACALAASRRATVELPMSERAWEAWTASRASGRRLLTFGTFAYCAPGLLALLSRLPIGADSLSELSAPPLLPIGLMAFGIICFTLAAIQAVRITRHRGPYAVAMDQDTVTLRLPSREAAMALSESELVQGQWEEEPISAEEEARLSHYDHALERELDELD